MDKKTRNQSLWMTVISETEFTAKKIIGSVKITFTFDAAP